MAWAPRRPADAGALLRLVPPERRPCSSEGAPLPGNFVVSNVRTTPMPLYLAGAWIASLLPISMLAPSQGLNVTLVSYCSKIDVGLVADPKLVPDLDGLAACFEIALEELESAAEGVVFERR